MWFAKITGQCVQKLLLTAAATVLLLPTPGLAEQFGDQDAVYQQDGTISEQLSLPVYHWSPKTTATLRGVVVAMHGLALHGKSFDALARSMASEGYATYSTDMRGYGRCSSENHHEFCTDRSQCRQRIDYEKSFADVVSLVVAARQNHKNTPLFLIGESLGAAMAIRLASTRPDLVDGLILSAPAIKRHSFVDPYLVANCGVILANPRAQLDLMPFVRKYASDDPRVISEMENDPLLRRRMSVYELLKSAKAVRRTMRFIAGIRPDVPVLVIQGSADRCIKANAVVLLLSKLRSEDQTVKWFHQRGHILVETQYVKPDTMDTVLGWINDHADMYQLQAKGAKTDKTSFNLYEQIYF